MGQDSISTANSQGETVGKAVKEKPHRKGRPHHHNLISCKQHGPLSCSQPGMAAPSGLSNVGLLSPLNLHLLTFQPAVLLWLDPFHCISHFRELDHRSGFRPQN